MPNYSKEEILGFIESESFPEDFSQWDTTLTDDGLAVAHVAAREHLLPRGFSKWDITDVDGWTVAHHCAQVGSLRPGFRDWRLLAPDGRTVAHVAAEYGNLPKGFQLWDIHDGEDWTVAHEAARHGTLPEGFDRWDIGKGAWSVAHEAAESGCLFAVLQDNSSASQVLAMTDGNGASVAWVSIDAGHPITSEHATRAIWRQGAKTQYSVAHAAASKGLLPEDFNDWGILDYEGATVAHTAAMHGHLSLQFKGWDLRDTSGWTVLEIAEEYGHYTAEQICKHEQFIKIMEHLEATDSLPEGLTHDDLALCDDNGFTIAHEAGYRGLLPEEFNDWDWADKNGRTVAHEAASAGLLPADFDQWALVDNTGWTVAHEAAQHAHESSIPAALQAMADRIPKDIWAAKDIEGATVGLFFKDLPEQKPETPRM